MKHLIVLPFAAALGVACAQAETKSFKHWVAGCDNVLTCTALGLTPEDGDPIGYVRIQREAGANAEISATIAVLAETEGPTQLTVTVDGKPFSGGPIAGEADGSHARVRLSGAQAQAFAEALVNAKTLTAQRKDLATGSEAISISLEGSSAALRYMDAEQKRDGGVTALVAKGSKTAASVPPAPAIPAISGRRMTSLETLPARPASLPAYSKEDCFNTDDEYAYMAVDLGGGSTLWGVCSGTGAYNFSFNFYVVGQDGKASQVTFTAPDTAPTEYDSFLTNPFVSEDGLTLSAFAKGRGLGDCGDFQSWAWDGSAFRLALHQSMDTCRGVLPDDWIQTYIADVK